MKKPVLFFGLLTFVSGVLGYIVFITVFPGFFSDDFYLFSLINGNSESIISLNRQDYFYLFYRPVSYFTHWFDIHVLSISPALMKMSSSVVVSLAGLFFFLTARELCRYTGVRFNPLISFVATVFVIFHSTMVTGVIWIANRNQLLMSLFYVLSLYFFFAYLNNRKFQYLVLLLLSFALSLLSKQFTVHLPFVLLCVLFLENENRFGPVKSMLSVVLIILLVSLAFLSVVSLTQNIEYSFLAESLWKKPFFYFNCLLYTFFPFIGDYVYSFAVNHKSVGLIAGPAFIILLIYLLLRRKIRFNKNTSLMLAVFIIAGFPAVLLSFEARFLSPQVILSGLLLIYLSSKKKSTVLTKIFIPALAVLNFIFSFYLVYDFRLQQIEYQKEILTLGETMKSSGRTKAIILCNNAVSQMYPYQSHFEKTGKFGMDSSIICSPVVCYPLGSYSYGGYPENNNLSVSRNNDTITVMLNSENFYLDIVSNGIKRSEILYLKVLYCQNGYNKNYNLLKLQLPPDFRDENTLLVYYNGNNWISLN